MAANTEQVNIRPPSVAVLGGPIVEAPRSIYLASLTPSPDIRLTRGSSPSGDSDSSHTATNYNSSPHPSPKCLDDSFTAIPGGDIAPISGDSIPTTFPDNERLRIQFMSPCSVAWFLENRYGRRSYLSDEPDGDEIENIPAKNEVSPRLTTVGRNWESCNHPEGQVYFRRVVGRKIFYTNTWLHNLDDLRDIEEAVDIIDARLSQETELSGSELDICVAVFVDEDKDKLACYYIADRDKEVMLWLTEQPMDILVECVGVRIFDTHHLGHAHQYNYWQHIEMFPHYRPYPKAQLRKMRSVLNYYLLDRVTSRTSCSLYDPDNLHRFIQLCSELKPPEEEEYASEEDMASFARMYAMIAHARLRHYHGTKWARLDSNRSIRNDLTSKTDEYSWWFKIVSSLLFWTPTNYMCRLDEIWTDENVNQWPWRTFIKELQGDWQDSITPSTIILTASVGYLAIQSVDLTSNGQPAVDRSAGQIMAYLATLLSIGNIISCTILGRQHRVTAYIMAHDAAEYLTRRAGVRWKTERLAIILSIPTGFFLWSLCAFLGGTLWLCLNATSIATRVSVAIVVLFATILLGLVASNGDWTVPEALLALPTTVKTTFQKLPVRVASPICKWTGTFMNSRRKTTPPEDLPQVPPPVHPRRAFSLPTIRKQPFGKTFSLVLSLSNMRAPDSMFQSEGCSHLVTVDDTHVLYVSFLFTLLHTSYMFLRSVSSYILCTSYHPLACSICLSSYMYCVVCVFLAIIAVP
ncbi:hypothetical protein BC628DRAFT_949364 [Trametes gibbosa]|nr:hypothetical protein BC628DRAFT_949364 [Trametes gibbosa]